MELLQSCTKLAIEILCLSSLLIYGNIQMAATSSGLIPDLRPANERSRYNVTPSLIGWAQT